MSLQTLERNSPSPQESENEDQGSLSSYEGFVCREGCAICLTPRPGASVGKHGGSLRIMNHLKKLNKLMRPQDAIKLAVELEKCSFRPVTRYMVVIATQGVQDTEETIVLGTEQATDSVKVCMVLPLWRNTEIKLDGDGGFSVHCQDKHHVLKPCSVQSMWTALQFLFKATELARSHNYYDGGLSHTWMTFYQAQRTDDGVILNEWNLQTSVVSYRPDSPIYYDISGVLDWSQLDSDKMALKNTLIQKLREVMLRSDLEEVTSRYLRQKLEAEMTMDLSEYRSFLDQQILLIFGQLEEPSKIHDYLYLGSEWNAANLAELKELGVGHILNITREIDNFYPETFKYKTVRVYDVPESELLKHWDDTYKFIKEAKENQSKVLVHCKMGISRSAATVIAYTMKEYRMSLEDARSFVKSRRRCINPNHGFMSQLKAYEGILKARYNDLFGTQAPSRISYQSRSSSDPNIRQRLFQDDLQPNNEEYTTELETEEHHLQMRPGSAGTSPSNQIDVTLETRVIDSLPPEKTEGMINYLVSLEPPLQEDEQDLGINVHSSSESDSPFSSPPLTPPDEETISCFMERKPNTSTNDPKQCPTSEKANTDIDSVHRHDTGYDNLLDVSSSSAPESTHDRVARATSLPTTLRPSSAERPYPCSPSRKSPSIKSPSSSHTQGSQDELDKLMEIEQVEENDDGDKVKVKTTLINSVNHRIKEIEKMNRPASAGKKGDNMSHASSEDSLHSCTLQGQPNISKDSSLSPIPSNEQLTSDITLLPVSGNVSTSTTCSDGLDSSRSGCDSPNTRYRKANEAAKMLLEQKRIRENDQSPLGFSHLNASSDDVSLQNDATGRGIRDLLGVFDKSSDDTSTGSLKRSSSVRVGACTDPKSTHKRGSSFGDII